ncbi:hypothetical protein Droror1_Dr00003963 [Drosera rotundifolia]
MNNFYNKFYHKVSEPSDSNHLSRQIFLSAALALSFPIQSTPRQPKPQIEIPRLRPSSLSSLFIFAHLSLLVAIDSDSKLRYFSPIQALTHSFRSLGSKESLRHRNPSDLFITWGSQFLCRLVMHCNQNGLSII